MKLFTLSLPFRIESLAKQSLKNKGKGGRSLSLHDCLFSILDLPGKRLPHPELASSPQGLR